MGENLYGLAADPLMLSMLAGETTRSDDGKQPSEGIGTAC